MVFIKYCSNSAVTEKYLNIIGKMFSDECVKEFKNAEEVKETDLLIVATEIDFLKCYLKGIRNIVYWMQGITAEESYLKHKSYPRKAVLNQITKFALKKSKAIFYVSEEMKRFEESKFKIDTSNKSFIMPCFNIDLDESSFSYEKKYANNVFAYVGSLSKWQCFSETVDFYKKIENDIKDTKLLVFTSEQELAKEILEKKRVKNYSVSFVSPQDMCKALYPVKFGFVLRDDIEVNRVATPTKLSSYMASGVIPVFSDCLCDFKKISSNMKFAVSVKNKKVPEKLVALINDKIDPEDISSEYADIFKTYYNPDYYIERYARSLKTICKRK